MYWIISTLIVPILQIVRDLNALVRAQQNTDVIDMPFHPIKT